MNRRRFFREGVLGGTAALGAGCFLLWNRGRLRAEVARRMLGDALPDLTGNALRELRTLPARAREEIKRYFHGACLNVAGFVTHVCSDAFGDRLALCQTRDEREARFLQAFTERVAGEAEILHRVETIAAEVGAELDSGWAAYCATLSGKWDTHIRPYGGPLALKDLSDRLGGMIRRELAQAAGQAGSAPRRPSFGQTVDKIGESAVMLLPMAKVKVAVGPRGVAAEGNPLVLPVFVLLALQPLWAYFAGQLAGRPGDYQAAMSGRLALLGLRVGDEFEREVRMRLADLHAWQEASVRRTAGLLAEERVGLI